MSLERQDSQSLERRNSNTTEKQGPKSSPEADGDITAAPQKESQGGLGAYFVSSLIPIRRKD